MSGTASSDAAAGSPAVAYFAPADRTVPAMLQRQAARHGTRTLFVAGDARWSFDGACAAAAACGAALREVGVGAGDRVALLVGNRVEFMQVLLGCAWIGAVAVPLNTAVRGEPLRHMLANCGARLLVAESDGLQAVLATYALGGAGVCIERAWLLDAPAPTSAAASAPFICEPFVVDAKNDAEPAPVRPGDTLAILYTSGTTGVSKGVCCPHAQYYWWALHSAELLGLRSDETLVTTLPLFHTNALSAFFQALLTGSTLVAEPRFSASAFWGSLVRHRATVTYVLGAMVPILLAREPSPQERAHGVRLALAPGVPARFQATFVERFDLPLLEGYGSTETNFVIGDTIDTQRAGTMGRVRPGFQARVADEDDHDVPDGEAGELLLRADEPWSFANGYFGMPEATVQAWRNGWFHTGDRVVRDADGRFRFVDRLKDAIRRRGENISSFEVEQVLLSHPAVALAAVFPVKSDLAEDEVACSIVLREGAALAPEALMKHCEARLAYFAIPRYVEFVAALPATASGKVQKFKLRERGVSAAAWDREAAGYRLER